MKQTTKVKTSAKKGFTLVEMIVAIGIFAIMSVAIAQAFASGFFGFKQAREIQRNLETAQFAMNTLAKELRTSTVVKMDAIEGSIVFASGIRFYDYSQDRCFYYYFSGPKLYAKWVNKANLPGVNRVTSECFGYNFGPVTAVELTTGYVSGGRFYVIPSSGASNPKVMGRIVVSMTIKQRDDANAKSVTVQSSVSSRDYNYVGI